MRGLGFRGLGFRGLGVKGFSVFFSGLGFGEAMCYGDLLLHLLVPLLSYSQQYQKD